MIAASDPLSIGLIGYGRLAKHLAPAFLKAGIVINQWYVRNNKYRDEIYDQYGIYIHSDLKLVDNSSDIIIIMVSDHAIQEVADQLEIDDTILCHTSGMSFINVLSQAHAGIFYPLNTFNGINPTWNEDTPIFIQGKNEGCSQLLTTLGKRISSHVQPISTNKLQTIHLAAVISQNFSNHLIGKAEEILLEQDIPREVIQPLLQSMIRNLANTPAMLNQTGPAVRQDTNTIIQQIQMLAGDEQFKEIYQSLTNSIQTNLFE